MKFRDVNLTDPSKIYNAFASPNAPSIDVSQILADETSIPLLTSYMETISISAIGQLKICLPSGDKMAYHPSFSSAFRALVAPSQYIYNLRLNICVFQDGSCS